MSYYFIVLKKYALFSGRANRSEYWFFQLFNVLIGSVLALIGVAGSAQLGGGNTAAFWLLDLYSLGVLLPSIAVSVRRLHDIGLSGLWFLIAFIPLGGIVLIVLHCLHSQAGPNRFGPDPNEVNPAANPPLTV